MDILGQWIDTKVCIPEVFVLEIWCQNKTFLFHREIFEKSWKNWGFSYWWWSILLFFMNRVSIFRHKWFPVVAWTIRVFEYFNCHQSKLKVLSVEFLSKFFEWFQFNDLKSNKWSQLVFRCRFLCRNLKKNPRKSVTNFKKCTEILLRNPHTLMTFR